MGWVCGRYRERRGRYGASVSKRALLRCRRGWKNDIKMDLKEVERSAWNGLLCLSGKKNWSAVAKNVINFGNPKNARNSLTTCGGTIFSRNMLHVVSTTEIYTVDLQKNKIHLQWKHRYSHIVKKICIYFFKRILLRSQICV